MHLLSCSETCLTKIKLMNEPTVIRCLLVCLCVYAAPQKENNCTLSANQTLPLNVTFTDNTTCTSVYNANLFSCTGCCSTWDEVELGSRSNGVSIAGGKAVGGYYDFKPSSCSRCSGVKVLTYFPIVCSDQSLRMIGLPEIQSCQCKSCCGPGLFIVVIHATVHKHERGELLFITIISS